MKTITLGQLLREKDNWSFFYCSNKYQYYMDNNFDKVVKIKKDIVKRYLNNELDKYPANVIPAKNPIDLTYNLNLI